MDWIEYQAALHLLAEERVGSVMRQAKVAEDDAFAESARNIKR